MCSSDLTNDPDNPSLIEHEEGWYIHDYAEHQETKADIEARRERNRLAGQKGGMAKAKRPAKRRASKPLSEVVSENVAEIELEIDTRTKEPPYPPQHEPSPQRQPARQTGAEKARAQLAAIPSRSVNAYRIAEAFSASLPVPIEGELLSGIGVQIDKCLKGGIPPPAIATGLQAWTNSDSWSPSQIPNFVHKANNRGHRNGNHVGKPTESALDYQAAAEQLLAKVSTK